MLEKEKYSRHYEESAVVDADVERVFAYADNHANFSSHMNQSSWMMAGGKMVTQTDEGGFRKAGSHLKMHGNVLGVKLFLDEAVTLHEPPHRKEWQTVGEVNLLVIDHYKLGFEIISSDGQTNLRVYIDYDLPQSTKTRWLGVLFGRMYAKWCVSQMISGVQKHFDRDNK